MIPASKALRKRIERKVFSCIDIDWKKLNVSIDWSKEISLSRLQPLYKSLSEKYRLVKKDGYPNMVMKSYSKDYGDNLLRAINFLKNKIKNLK